MGQDGVIVNTGFLAYLLWSGWLLLVGVHDVIYRLKNEVPDSQPDVPDA